MALVSVTGAYGIQTDKFVQTPSSYANNTVNVNASNVAYVDDFTGRVGQYGVTITDGSRIWLTGVAGVQAIITNLARATAAALF